MIKNKIILVGLLILLSGCVNQNVNASLINEDEVVTNNDIKDYANQPNGILSINSIESIDGSLIDITNSGLDDGENLVKVNMTIANPTQDVLTYNSVNIVAYDENQEKIITNSLYYNADEQPLLYGDIQPGNSNTGFVYFSVNKSQSIKNIALLDEEFNLIDAVSVDL